MEIYLPIAEMSVHWLIVLGMGGGIGFLSGMFGVGGGFLLTPLLIFYGIPSEVAVATTASHITASSMAGAIAQWRRRAIDFKMAGVMLAGGLGGTALGVSLLGLLRAAGMSEIVVSAGFVILLGTVGGLMLSESLETLRAARSGTPLPSRTALHHNWIHGLPLKMRFRQSRLYISVFPPLVLGFLVGMLSAIMGVGGGFILVPAMIYLLRVPTSVVMGTSLVQILFVTAATTVLQAANNYTVDILLAGLLVLGGVVGAQFGVRMAARLRGEHLRLLLALLVLAVAARLFVGLVVTPARSVLRVDRGAMMRAATLAIVLALIPAAAGADDLVSGLSQDQIQITSNFTGSDLVVFGAIENQDLSGTDTARRDVVVVVRGPVAKMDVRRKSRIAGIWINNREITLAGMPSYYYVASTQPLAKIALPQTLERYQLGLDNIEPETASTHNMAKAEPFRQAVIRARQRERQFAEAPSGVEFLSATLFRVHIPLPAEAPRGQYVAEVYLFSNGVVTSAQSTPLFVEQIGLERRLFNFAHEQPLYYGFATMLMAVLVGWLSSLIFRQT